MFSYLDRFWELDRIDNFSAPIQDGTVLFFKMSGRSVNRGIGEHDEFEWMTEQGENRVL